MPTSRDAPLPDYTGHVSPGDPPAVRESGDLRVTKVCVGPMQNNAYLLECLASGRRLLIDAADDAATLTGVLGDGGLERVVTTHSHRDHWQALAEVVERTGARTAAGRADAPQIPVATDELLDDGDTVVLGERSLAVLGLRGHTPGSVALLLEEPPGTHHLFTGDSLFPGGPGKTAGPAEFTSLMDDLEARVFARLPDSTWFYPGHGDDSTLGTERGSLHEWRSRGW